MPEPMGRFALAHLSKTPSALGLEPSVGVAADTVTLDGYGRFKHGDGAEARRLGVALGHLAARHLPRNDGPLLVASSGFAFAPPAAYGLVPPIVATLREHGIDARPLRVHRAALTNGDYAKMSLADRQAALSDQGLSIEGRIDGARVLAVDDVRMTGVHEGALDDCLRAAGAAEVVHGYVLDAYAARDEPRTESLLNSSGVASTTALLEIACAPDFVPNARFCKRVLTMPSSTMADALAALPDWVLEWIEEAAALDDYAAYPAYREGVLMFGALRQAAQAGVTVG